MERSVSGGEEHITPWIEDSRRVSQGEWVIDVRQSDGQLANWHVPDRPIVAWQPPAPRSIPPIRVPEWVRIRREELRKMAEQNRLRSNSGISENDLTQI